MNDTRFAVENVAAMQARLSALGWGLFFVWVGVVMLLDFGSAIGALGVGIITLGVQVVRKLFGLALEGFWVAVGVVFAAGGIWALYEINLPLVPVLLVVAGVILLISALRSKTVDRVS